MKRIKLQVLFFLVLILADRVSGYVKVTNSNLDFGKIIASGDFNGDGHTDYAFGSYGENSSQGVVYLIFGSASAPTSSFSTTSLSNGIKISGSTSETGKFGFDVAMADVDGDGKADLIISATGTSTNKGTIYIIFGSNTLTSDFTITSPPVGEVVQAILGTATSSNFGAKITTADVNNDGCADIIAYSSNDNASKGAVYVIYGGNSGTTYNRRTTVPTLSSNGFLGGMVIKGPSSVYYFGNYLASAGDINADNKDDILIGNTDGAGAVYLISSSILSNDNNVITCDNTATVSGVFRFAGDSTQSTGAFGTSMASVGDLDNDSLPEIVIGAPGENSNIGAAYLIKSSVYATSQPATGFPVASTSQIIRIGGDTSATGQSFGYSVAAAGNLNGDSLQDFFVGAPFEDSYAGAAYFISGARSFSSAFTISASSSVTGVIRIPGASGSSNYPRFGTRFSSATSPMVIGGQGMASFLTCLSTEFSSNWYTCYTCSSIHSSCTSCTSTSTCSGCSTGFTVSGGTCVSSSGNNNNSGNGPTTVESGTKKLSGGGIAGVVIGCVAFAVIVLVVILVVLKGRKNKARKEREGKYTGSASKTENSSPGGLNQAVPTSPVVTVVTETEPLKV